MTEAARFAAARPPAVTVIVPCFNYAHFLPSAVRSAVSQDGVDVQVIIVDDASSDATPEVAARLEAASPNVSVVRHDSNGGLVATMNHGFALAEGDYVVKLDADDMLTPGSLARSVRLLESYPDVGFVYGHPVRFTEHPPVRLRSAVRSWTLWSGRDWVERRCRAGSNCISNPEVVIRRAALAEAGPVTVEMPLASDLELWIRLASVADVGRVNGPDQALYRVHGQSMSRLSHGGVVNDLESRAAAFWAAFAGPVGSRPDAGELYETARLALAKEALDRACRAYERGRTEEVPVADLVAFAEKIWPGAGDLRECRALRRRQAVGPALARVAPPFLGHAVARRVADEFYWWSWRRAGV
jgi:hypothetical protein